MIFSYLNLKNLLSAMTVNISTDIPYIEINIKDC